ncbi:hypothetical protein GCM10009672_01240 [Nesterenkonia lutea]
MASPVMLARTVTGPRFSGAMFTVRTFSPAGPLASWAIGPISCACSGGALVPAGCGPVGTGVAAGWMCPGCGVGAEPGASVVAPALAVCADAASAAAGGLPGRGIWGA